MTDQALYALLESEVSKRDTITELSFQKPDPLMVAKKYQDEYVALICALFGYGNASLIVKFLQSLDFSLLEAKEDAIVQKLHRHYYRFQNAQDVAAIFITLKRAKQQRSLEDAFWDGYQKEYSVLDGLSSLIGWLYSLNTYESRGYRFLLGVPPGAKSISTYKRWNMFLRWMVRKDSLDMGLWKRVDKRYLLMPLDTHTFKVSGKLGLLKRKSYDLKSVIALTERLRSFDPDDPVKYDFALYRIGQENILGTLK